MQAVIPARLKPAIRFIVFAAFLVALFGVLYVPFGRMIRVDVLCVVTAHIVVGICELFGASTTIDGNLVSLNGFSLRVIAECTGIFEMVVFSAFVAAYPTGVKAKALGILLGFVSIYAYNVARIVGLLVIGRYSIGSFALFHLYLWQVTLVAVVIVNWLLWLRLIVHREPATSA